MFQKIMNTMVPEKCPSLSKRKSISAIISKKLPILMNFINISRNVPQRFYTQTIVCKKLIELTII